MPNPMSKEQASDVRNSNIWKYVCDEIDYRIALKIESLRSCGKDQLEVIQAELSALEDVKRLPEDVAERESNPESVDP